MVEFGHKTPDLEFLLSNFTIKSGEGRAEVKKQFGMFNLMNIFYELFGVQLIFFAATSMLLLRCWIVD